MAMEAHDHHHKLKLLVLCLLMAITIPALKANIADYDEVWQQREIDADQLAKEVYRDDPIEITDHFNKAVNDHLEGTNDTRRNLRHKYAGPCMATNPMDACWRCDPNWEKNRQKLADCALGFARGTTGGKGGPIYIVKEAGDQDVVNPKPGTLRHAVIQPGPLWITFSHDMKITLKQELMMTSDKTIDARGHNVHVEGGCQITLQFVRNIIISNLHVRDIVPCKGGLVRDSWNHIGLRTVSDGDGISLFGASKVWIDHVSGSKCADGLIDVIAGSTAITISNSHFTNHNDVMLFGSSDTFTKDEVMQITLAFNHFGQGLIQRMPRCRFGFFHVVNNDYTHWIMYAIGGSSHPTILSQGNRYVAPNLFAAKEVCNRVNTSPAVWKNWNWRSQGDLMVNGARFTESGTPIRNVPMVNLIQAKPGTMVTELTRFSGPLKCSKGKPC